MHHINTQKKRRRTHKRRTYKKVGGANISGANVSGANVRGANLYETIRTPSFKRSSNRNKSSSYAKLYKKVSATRKAIPVGKVRQQINLLNRPALPPRNKPKKRMM